MKEFVKSTIKPYEKQEGSIKQIFQSLGSNHMLGMSGTAYKEQDLELLENHMQLMKELCTVSISGLMISYLSQGWLIDCLERFGTDEYHHHALAELKTGKKIGAFCLTEPGHGSNYTELQTISHYQDERWSIKGAKNYITNGGIADYFFVATRTDSGKRISIFLLEKNMPGIKIEKKNEFIGNQQAAISYISFDCSDIEEKHLIGKKGSGLFILPKCLNFERMDLALYAVYLSETVLEETVAFLKERGTDTNKILDLQVVKYKLVSIRTKIDIIKKYVISTSNDILSRKEVSKDITISKIAATEMASEVILECCQLCGGYGFTKESNLISRFNDIAALTIGGGSNDVLRNSLYKHVFSPQKEPVYVL